MKRFSFFFLYLLLLVPFTVSHAQSPVTAVESLTVALWPDYDKAAVLVLLTGTLAEDTPLPATITIPLPETADFNVVARIDGNSGDMIDDVEYSINQGQLTFTTPDLRFQIEYYLPYTTDGDQHTFNFSWVADLSVDQLEAKVQKPLSASSVLTEPETTDVITGDDGFTYYILPSQSVPAGQPFSVQLDYKMNSPQLSVESSSPAITDVQTTGFSTTPTSEPETNWPVIAAVGGGILIIIAIIWQIATVRATSRPRKPRPVRARKQESASQYCHNCGSPVGRGAKFCRECGTAVK